MGSRSRKRGRTAPRTAAPARTARGSSPAGGPTAAGGATAPSAGATGPDAPKPSRSEKTEAKNQAVRANLEPLAPGERPRWVTYAAILAFALGLLNVALYYAGVRVEGATIGSTVVMGAVLILCAAGMWRCMYGAVLAFEVLLGITGSFAALSLLVANTWAGAIRAVLVVTVSGVFFWKLIRAMARLQMPGRPGSAGG